MGSIEIGEIKYDVNDYLETYFEVTSEIQRRLRGDNRCIVTERHEAQGLGGMYELAKELTDEFMLKYDGIVWGDELDWMDTVDGYLKESLG